MGGCKSKGAPAAEPSASITLVPGVDADTLGREWRCKFADGGGADGGLINSKALEEAQKLLDENIAALKALDGVKRIGRICCGGCKDFKIIVTMPLSKYEAWEKNEYSPEKDFLAKLGGIEGITAVETQKYTAMSMYEAASPPEAGEEAVLAPGVKFNTLGREWRCKFADGGGADGGLINSKALEEAQKLLDENMAALKALDGVASVTRIVCGGCKDFKVIVAMPAAKYGPWETAEFAPEKDFLDKLGKIEGITAVETQKYTIAEL